MQLIEVPKLWGSEQWANNDSDYCMKALYLNRGFQSSMHYHERKKETFMCVAGKVKLEIMPHYKTSAEQYGVIHNVYLQPYQSYTLLPGVPHRFQAITDGAVVIEASTFHSDEDVVRLEESRRIGG